MNGDTSNLRSALTNHGHALNQQNDELLAALKYTRNLLSDHEIPIADAAINKAEKK